MVNGSKLKDGKQTFLFSLLIEHQPVLKWRTYLSSKNSRIKGAFCKYNPDCNFYVVNKFIANVMTFETLRLSKTKYKYYRVQRCQKANLSERDPHSTKLINMHKAFATRWPAIWAPGHPSIRRCSLRAVHYPLVGFNVRY